MSFMGAPADNMTADHFARPRYKNAIWMFLRQTPCSLHTVNDVGMPDVFVEVPDPIVKPNDIRNRDSSVERVRELGDCVSVADKTIQTTFADVLDDAECLFRLI